MHGSLSSCLMCCIHIHIHIFTFVFSALIFRQKNISTEDISFIFHFFSFLFFWSWIALHLHWAEFFSIKWFSIHHCKMQLISNGLFFFSPSSEMFSSFQYSEMFSLTSLMAICMDVYDSTDIFCLCWCCCFLAHNLSKEWQKNGNLLNTSYGFFDIYKWHARYFYLWIIIGEI